MSIMNMQTAYLANLQEAPYQDKTIYQNFHALQNSKNLLI